MTSRTNESSNNVYPRNHPGKASRQSKFWKFELEQISYGPTQGGYFYPVLYELGTIVLLRGGATSRAR